MATASPQIYTLSLHDALPICFSAEPVERWLSHCVRNRHNCPGTPAGVGFRSATGAPNVHRRKRHGSGRVPTQAGDRKSTRLNSSHTVISYAVFCLKKKKKRI